jgi:hypothetical protein
MPSGGDEVRINPRGLAFRSVPFADLANKPVEHQPRQSLLIGWEPTVHKRGYVEV